MQVLSPVLNIIFSRFFSLVFLSVLTCSNSYGQRVVVGMPNVNVLYVGYENPVSIAVDGYKPMDIVVAIRKGGVIEGDLGEYIIKPDGSTRSLELIIGINKNGRTEWVDSLDYRVRPVQIPETMLGTRTGGSSSYGELMTMRFLSAGLFLSPIQYQVTSFNIYVLGTNSFYSESITGNKLSTKSLQALAKLYNGGYIIINNVQGEWAGKYRIVDTIVQLDPIVLQVKGNYFTDDEYLLSGDIIDQVSGRKERKTYEIELGEPDNQIKLCDKVLDGMWSVSSSESKTHYYFKNNELERVETYAADSTLLIKVTYIDGAGKYTEYFSDGTLYREGSFLALVEPSNQRDIFNDNQLPKFYPSVGHLKGKWKVYHPNGVLREEGAFDTLMVHRKVNVTNNDHYLLSERAVPNVVSVRQGTWKFYNENGELVEEKFFDKESGRK